MDDLISRKALLAEYDRVHIGEPGKARNLIEDAPRVDAFDAPHWATETAYKNGYKQGVEDALDKIKKPRFLLKANGDIVPIPTCHQWIPVSERLPEVVDSYLVVVKYKYDWEKEYGIDTDVATYNPYEKAYIDDCWNTYNDWDEGQQYLHVTHWMPLPPVPEENK